MLPGPVALALAVAVAVVACAPTTVTPVPTAIVPSASTSAAPAGSGPGPSGPVGPPSTAAAVTVDATLLDVLPEEVEGQLFRPDLETAAEVARSEDLHLDVEAIALALYIAPGASSNADDLAIVNVVRLKPGVFGEDWYRSWRSTYDEGACQVAGGVSPGSAEATIGDHETHIGTCQGGVHTYHVHLTNPDRVISITAAGERRFGERVVAGLTE